MGFQWRANDILIWGSSILNIFRIPFLRLQHKKFSLPWKDTALLINIILVYIPFCFYSRRSTSFLDVILHAVNRFARINTVKYNPQFEPVSFNIVCT